jgi:hypothetical protein
MLAQNAAIREIAALVKQKIEAGGSEDERKFFLQYIYGRPPTGGATQPEWERWKSINYAVSRFVEAIMAGLLREFLDRRVPELKEGV